MFPATAMVAHRPTRSDPPDSGVCGSGVRASSCMVVFPGRGGAQRDGLVTGSGSAVRVDAVQVGMALAGLVVWVVIVFTVVMVLWKRR